MCGRFSLDGENPKIKKYLNQLPAGEDLVKTGEVFPTDPCLTLILNDNQVMPKKIMWGFPKKEQKGIIINARCESAMFKPMFAKPLRERRVAIPTSGYFEWKAIPDSKKKEKYLFRQNDKDILFLAGLWTHFSSLEKYKQDRFCILTTNAEPSLAQYHNRMPVLLHENEVESWLQGHNLDEILTRIPFSLEAIQAI